MNEKTILLQKKVCDKYQAQFLGTELDMIIGVSNTVKSGEMPINGLRIHPEDNSSGWFIWGGEYSDSDDFFFSLHSKHLLEWNPIIYNYLGLAPGWRFQIDNSGYEDVWHDSEILKD